MMVMMPVVVAMMVVAVMMMAMVVVVVMVMAHDAAMPMDIPHVVVRIADDARAVVMVERLGGRRKADRERQCGGRRKQCFPQHLDPPMKVSGSP
jgi:hypothetical protein